MTTDIPLITADNVTVTPTSRSLDNIIDERAAKRRRLTQSRNEMIKAISSFFPGHNIVLEIDEDGDSGIKAITMTKDGRSLTIEGELRYGSRCSITINPF